jgi:hypothetical protein
MHIASYFLRKVNEMKNLIALAAVAMTGVVFAGEKSQPAAATPVAKTQPAKAECVTCVEAAPRRLLGRREVVLVPATKTVTVYETKKVLVEKEVKVPVKKEVAVAVPVKVSSSCCDCEPVARVRGRLLGARNRVASVVDCVTCK